MDNFQHFTTRKSETNNIFFKPTTFLKNKFVAFNMFYGLEKKKSKLSRIKRYKIKYIKNIFTNFACGYGQKKENYSKQTNLPNIKHPKSCNDSNLNTNILNNQNICNLNNKNILKQSKVDFCDLSNIVPCVKNVEKNNSKVFSGKKISSGKIGGKRYFVDGNTGKKYLRGDFLGKGGFAKCYSVKEIVSSREYACKVIRKERISTPNKIKKMKREIAIHQQLCHQNVVVFHDFFEDFNSIYIVLELCRQSSLDRLIKEGGPLTELHSKHFFYQTLSGLAYLQVHQVVHRDLKPGNLLIDSKNRIKIADFGLAIVDLSNNNNHCKGKDYKKLKALEEQSNDSRILNSNGINRPKRMCGTPNYLAPEIITNQTYSFASDVWALGCIFYIMLCGYAPFEADRIRETMHNISKASYVIPIHFSVNAARLISNIFEVNPVKRPIVTYLQMTYICKCSICADSTIQNEEGNQYVKRPNFIDGYKHVDGFSIIEKENKLTGKNKEKFNQKKEFNCIEKMYIKCKNIDSSKDNESSVESFSRDEESFCEDISEIDEIRSNNLESFKCSGNNYTLVNEKDNCFKNKVLPNEKSSKVINNGDRKGCNEDTDKNDHIYNNLKDIKIKNSENIQKSLDSMKDKSKIKKNNDLRVKDKNVFSKSTSNGQKDSIMINLRDTNVYNANNNKVDSNHAFQMHDVYSSQIEPEKTNSASSYSEERGKSEENPIVLSKNDERLIKNQEYNFNTKKYANYILNKDCLKKPPLPLVLNASFTSKILYNNQKITKALSNNNLSSNESMTSSMHKFKSNLDKINIPNENLSSNVTNLSLKNFKSNYCLLKKFTESNSSSLILSKSNKSQFSKALNSKTPAKLNEYYSKFDGQKKRSVSENPNKIHFENEVIKINNLNENLDTIALKKNSKSLLKNSDDVFSYKIEQGSYVKSKKENTLLREKHLKLKNNFIKRHSLRDELNPVTKNNLNFKFYILSKTNLIMNLTSEPLSPCLKSNAKLFIESEKKQYTATQSSPSKESLVYKNNYLNSEKIYYKFTSRFGQNLDNPYETQKNSNLCSKYTQNLNSSNLNKILKAHSWFSCNNSSPSILPYEKSSNLNARNKMKYVSSNYLNKQLKHPVILHSTIIDNYSQLSNEKSFSQMKSKSLTNLHQMNLLNDFSKRKIYDSGLILLKRPNSNGSGDRKLHNFYHKSFSNQSNEKLENNQLGTSMKSLKNSDNSFFLYKSINSVMLETCC